MFCWISRAIEKDVRRKRELLTGTSAWLLPLLPAARILTQKEPDRSEKNFSKICHVILLPESLSSALPIEYLVASDPRPTGAGRYDDTTAWWTRWRLDLYESEFQNCRERKNYVRQLIRRRRIISQARPQRHFRPKFG